MAATASSSSSDPVTAALPSSAAPHPPRAPFLRSPNPPLFLGRPINPQPGGPGTAPLYPAVGRARVLPPRPLADRVVAVSNPAGYIRNSGPAAAMAHAQAHGRPFMFAASSGAGDPAVHVQQQQQQQQLLLPTSGAHTMRPSIPQQHQFVVPRQQMGNGGAPRTAAPSKVAPFAAIPSVPENNSNDRENSREDSIVVIHDRKVRLSEGTSGSLYALCRSWVRNGLPQESQPTFGDSLRILPKPLPAALVNMQANTSEDSNENDKSDKDEDLGPIEQLSAQDLLKGHIKHAKKVRARLNKERHLRIERYKQRLSLLLPTQIELIGRNEATPGS